MKTIEMSMAQATIENSIMTFVGDPPDTDFQLGYLAALVDTLTDIGGTDYGEFLILCRRNMAEGTPQ